MKKNILILLGAIVLLIFATVGCDKKEKENDQFEVYEAKGYVLGKTTICEGNGLYIEVTNPKGIGKKGTFKSLWGNDNPTWNYDNAIRIPHFDKVNLPVELMKVGTFLHFEYRKYYPDKDGHYFDHKQYCTMDHIPPTSNTYIITKIISSKPKN